MVYPTNVLKIFGKKNKNIKGCVEAFKVFKGMKKKKEIVAESFMHLHAFYKLKFRSKLQSAKTSHVQNVD